MSPISIWSAREIQPPQGGQKTLFLAWTQGLVRANPQALSTLEKNGLELAERYWAYQDVRRGQKLEVLPIQGSKTQQWVSIGQLLQADWDDKNDPTGQIRKVKKGLQKAQAAFLAGAAEEFNAASASLIAALQRGRPAVGRLSVGARSSTWRWPTTTGAPFRVAWVCTLLALLRHAVGAGHTVADIRPVSDWRFYAAGILAMLVGFGMRMIISGRAPVTNMYESVVFVGLGTAVLGVMFELVYRNYYSLLAAAAVSTVTLILAELCPAILDPSIRPLTPVLRSNFWLVIHVMTIMLSYAAFALALLTGNVALGFGLRRWRNTAAIAALSKLTYQFLQAGVLLLILGTFLARAGPITRGDVSGGGIRRKSGR